MLFIWVHLESRQQLFPLIIYLRWLIEHKWNTSDEQEYNKIGRNKMIFKVPSHPNISMILWFYIAVPMVLKNNSWHGVVCSLKLLIFF